MQPCTIPVGLRTWCSENQVTVFLTTQLLAFGPSAPVPPLATADFRSLQGFVGVLLF